LREEEGGEIGKSEISKEKDEFFSSSSWL